jgi:serine protease
MTPRLRHPFLSRTAASAAAAALLGAGLFAVPAAAAEQPAAPAVPAVPQQEQAVPTDRIIVKFRDGAGRSARGKAYGRAAKALGVPVEELRTTAGGATVLEAGQELSPDEAGALAAGLESDPAVEYAEPDIMMHVQATGADPYYPMQWDLQEPAAGLAGLNLPAAWQTTEGAGQVVAVVDSGITAHGDLDANVLPGYDMITSPDIARDGNGRDSSPQDEGDWHDAGQCGGTDASSPSSWHGTHVAGTIAALRGNALGVSGVAPRAKVLPVRALGACGGYMSDIADALLWAAGGTVPGAPANPTPADVVNLSLGGSGTCSATFQSAIDQANALGAPVVVAAGNSNTDAAAVTPANCANVITVAASGKEGNRAPYSNYGSHVDLTAPGGDASTGSANGILSTVNAGTTVPGGGSYAYMQGTSMATPHVAATAALMLAANPSLTPAQVEALLKSSARPGPGNCSQGCGAGLADAAAALKAATAGTGAPAPATAPAPAQEPAPSPSPQPATLAAAVPTITGTPAVGRPLTAAAGAWGPAPVTLAYQWYRAGTAISGATSPSYTPSSTDLGAALKVRVTGSKTGYATATRESAATAPVAAGTLATSAPTITGTAKAGYKLTASPGTWTAGTSLAYQWYRGTSAIQGATGRTYVLSGYDAGQRMSVRVTGSKAGYTTAKRYSAQTAAVAKGTLSASTPTVSGTTKVGYRLAASPGTWTTGTTLRYQWYRSGSPISGATGRTYLLAAADRYDTIKVRVTGTRTGYATASRYSYSTARIR